MESQAQKTPSSTTDISAGDTAQISFVSHNPSAPITILFIRGAFGSHADWDKVVSHMPPTYHLLIPSLHVDSKGQPRTFDLCIITTLLSLLVSTHAKSGKAHVVGLSLGAHVSAGFAASYPGLTLSLFTSGFAPLINRRAWYYPLVPYILMTDVVLLKLTPRWLVAKMMDGYAPEPDSQTSHEGKRDIQASRDVADAVCTSMETQGPVTTRVLVVVAGKGGLLPTSDSVESAKWFVERMKGVEGQGVGDPAGATTMTLVKAPNMRHGWSVICPEAFARSVCLWVDQGELDEGFELM
ncbi:alpha beta-hydrolase [Coniophora puteana RWD-64-598 SS2]|uniref:Alpha beta-hydrolase n=1 Tax=Coniophora puteana (strain RWD-64-598) TaxID=741705 RepID=A0A5M3MRF0_CONPW|nr:alpha beta-hydrolase [Coniophora puteana RWD-64-598 SS2]EIW81670.1 alpha beta-hydrolase [Coniophora puteana RWD-64-598 SS2]